MTVRQLWRLLVNNEEPPQEPRKNCAYCTQCGSELIHAITTDGWDGYSGERNYIELGRCDQDGRLLEREQEKVHRDVR